MFNLNSTVLQVPKILSMLCITILTSPGVKGQEGHNAKNSLDWAGIYKGIIPCADCEGIETTVFLNKNQHFKVKSVYLGRKVNPRMDDGKFGWSPDGNSIFLKDSAGREYAKYKVKEDALIQLDMNGEPITGPLAGNFMLTKGFYAIQEKYWKLTELNGSPVTLDSTLFREPHLILKENSGRFSGNGGCNNISGQYKLVNPDSIYFSKAISTMMACPGLALESSFLKCLDKARTYKVSGDKLEFKDAEKKSIAVFKTMNMH
jgi:heat shock protein HslJ